MTTEEKARAYDEALKRARKAIVDCGDNEGRKRMIYGIHPELRENEDERIRKGIIAHIQGHLDTQDDFIRRQATGPFSSEEVKFFTDALAWLEKQKALSELGKYIADKRSKVGFYYNHEEVSWNEIPLEDRKHDYPYYFDGDIDCYPFVISKQKKPKELFDVNKFFVGKDVTDFKKELFFIIRGSRELKPTDEEIWLNIENQIAPNLIDILQEEKSKNITANLLEDGITGVQRELIEFLANNIDVSWVDVIKSADVYAQRIRSMVEKQKEQKPIEDVVKDITKNKESTIKFLKSTGIMDDNGELAEMYRSEQKPAEWSKDYREEDIQTRFAFYTYKDDPSVLYLSNVFVEESSRNHGFGTRILKAAEKVAEAIGAIAICLKVKQDSPANAWYRKRGYGYMAFEDGYDWLEKNLEYLKQAKSAEWSEEDERLLTKLMTFVDIECFDRECNGKDLIDWLKSLRPSWKPSEEQIKTLKWCRPLFCDPNLKNILESLIDDLEKLM